MRLPRPHLFASAAFALAALAAVPAAAQTRPDYDASGSRGDDDGYARQGPSAYGQAPDGAQGQDPSQELARQLRLRPDQQSAFRDYQTAFQAGQDQPPYDDPSRLAGMTTPERIDASARQMERDRADFERVSAATRRFYAALDGEQRRTFDRVTAPPADDGYGSGGGGADDGRMARDDEGYGGRTSGDRDGYDRDRPPR